MIANLCCFQRWLQMICHLMNHFLNFYLLIEMFSFVKFLKIFVFRLTWLFSRISTPFSQKFVPDFLAHSKSISFVIAGQLSWLEQQPSFLHSYPQFQFYFGSD